MTGLMFEVKITAVGEVRDKDGNLLSSEPLETTMVVNQQQLDELQKGGLVP
jgi:hypothetical protein